jgi:hypothetical protein
MSVAVLFMVTPYSFMIIMSSELNIIHKQVKYLLHYRREAAINFEYLWVFLLVLNYLQFIL